MIVVRNLRVGNSHHTYYFPLDQVNGNEVPSADGQITGFVSNPYWMVNDNFHWRKAVTFESNTPAGHSFYAPTHEILYYNNSQMQKFNIMHRQTSKHKFSSPCPVRLYLGTNFTDLRSGRLYTYETFRPGKRPDEVSVASLDLATMQWKGESTAELAGGQMHHHGGVLLPRQNRFMLYGGFANMRYHSDFYAYNLADGQWNAVSGVGGKRFPRYFCSMGYDGRRYVYIFGGMGNDSGDQTVGRRYFYDLHRLDLATNRVDKVWTVKWPANPNIVFVRGMVLMGGWFYTLGYSEFSSNSTVKLYRFRLSDGHAEQLGDSIVIHPDRIETEANLFYDPLLHKFVATIQEFKDENRSVFRAYTIETPVLTEAQYNGIVARKAPHDSRLRILLVAIVGTVGISAVGLVLWRRRRKHSPEPADTRLAPAETRKLVPNSIKLFGEFTVCDRSGHDITYMFTDKLRQIFCLLLESSNSGGLSSTRLGNLLWGDKPPEKIKNSKSVAMNHLRRVLKEIDGVSVTYRSGNFMLHTEPPFECDYTTLVRVLEVAGDNVYASAGRLLGIVGRGKFLDGLDSPSVDSFKLSAETLLLKPLRTVMLTASERGDTSLVLQCVRCLFFIDPTDEEAFRMQTRTLKRLGRDLELEEAVIRFRSAYKKSYGEDFVERKQ